MSDGETDSVSMLAGTRPAVRRFTARSVSMFVPSTRSDSDSDTAATPPHSAAGGGAVFHTGPLSRSARRPPGAHLLPWSGPLYGGGNRGLSTPPPYERERIRAPAVMPEEAATRGWVGEAGGDDGKKEHLLSAGQLGMCSDPYCTTCPGVYHAKAAQRNPYRPSTSLENRLQHNLYGEARGWARKSFSFINSSFPIMNPHAKIVQRWNKFFVISCLVAIFIDPLFFFILSVDEFSLTGA